MKSNIRKLRNEKQMSQTQLAEVIGKTQQTVSHMEKDRDRIPIESLITMSEYFGVSTDYILGIEPDENSEKSQTVKNSSQQVKDKTNRNTADESKKILYQLILTLLLDSMDDDAQSVIASLGSHV